MDENLVLCLGVGSPERVKFCERNDSEEEEEKARMINQARLAFWLKRAFDRRQFGKLGFRGTRDKRTEEDRVHPAELQLHEDRRWVVRLPGVEIIPSGGKQTIIGALEAHSNGFRYLAEGGFYVDIMHLNVENYLFRLGHRGRRPPLLQFHLKQPIWVGNALTKDVQFLLIDGSGRDEDLDNFVRRVQVTQWSCGGTLPFTLVRFEAVEFEFDGDFPKGASASFALTYSALVVLTQTPFFVVPLSDIEIVNLARPRTETVETIDMVVVFKDYTRDVLEICSIPLKFLTGIKHCLNSRNVKYYVNRERPNWKSLLGEIEESPRKYKDEGGWDFLEDYRTLSHYSLAKASEGRLAHPGETYW